MYKEQRAFFLILLGYTFGHWSVRLRRVCEVCRRQGHLHGNQHPGCLQFPGGATCSRGPGFCRLPAACGCTGSIITAGPNVNEPDGWRLHLCKFLFWIYNRCP